MGLNHDTGEIIDGLDGPWRVVPNEKWRESALFDQAATEAAAAFQQQGALLPVTFDDAEVVTQEYPRTNQLAFVFLKSVRGAELYYPYIFEIPDKMIAEIRAIGKWESIQEH